MQKVVVEGRVGRGRGRDRSTDRSEPSQVHESELQPQQHHVEEEDDDSDNSEEEANDDDEHPQHVEKESQSLNTNPSGPGACLLE